MSSAGILIALLMFCTAVVSAAPAQPPPPDSSDPTRGLDLTEVELAHSYEADFSRPLELMNEAGLFESERRVRVPPARIDWILEGRGNAHTEAGRLVLSNGGNDVVLWNTHRFPADFLLEFSVLPHDANKGLNIVFFAAMGRKGGGIFDLSQPKRDGRFRAYHSGGLDAYHVSYWATDEDGKARGTAHIRKNYGFHRVAVGKDFITGQGPGPHRVRVLKLNGNIEVEVNGRIAVRWHDDGRTFGPVLGEGFIGLRQMAYTQDCRYTHFRVWAAKARVPTT